MPNYSMPVNPVGSFDPCFNTNLYGASWDQNWNTCIYGDPMQYGANVLSNCTGYAQGRMLKIYMELNPGYDPAALGYHLFDTLNGDPVGYNDGWIPRARNIGLDILDHPEEGTVLVTGSHVAVVERYDEGYGWLISESGYLTLPPWSLNYTMYESGGTWYSSYATDHLIIGFIKIPGTTPGPGPTPPRRKRPLIFYLKNWNNV